MLQVGVSRKLTLRWRSAHRKGVIGIMRIVIGITRELLGSTSVEGMEPGGHDRGTAWMWFQLIRAQPTP